MVRLCGPPVPNPDRATSAPRLGFAGAGLLHGRCHVQIPAGAQGLCGTCINVYEYMSLDAREWNAGYLSLHPCVASIPHTQHRIGAQYVPTVSTRQLSPPRVKTYTGPTGTRDARGE